VAVDGVPSEMAPMLDALNGLFARIGELMESERRFTADAAHELRTPIAAIRAQAQVALEEADDVLRRRALHATLDGCDRASHLVDQLLTLSRLEAGADSPQQRLDLCAVARGVVAALAGGAIDKRQQLEFDANEPCIVRGNQALLGVLIRNLVDNAIRYSPPGATVKVAVRPQPEQVVLTVEDSGPGLADEDRARLGQRFFRVLGSEQSGSGLGWSIVERIAATQRAELQVGRSETLGGLAVEVRWPGFPDRA
jgi:two-component system sensor histidine kinase QseC